MYIHDIVEDLTKNLEYNQGAPHYDEIYSMSDHIDTILQSEVYYFDNLDKLIVLVNKDLDYSLKGFGNTLRLPFGNVSFEAFFIDKDGNKVKFCLSLVNKIDHYELIPIYINYDLHGKAWVLPAYKIILKPTFDIQKPGTFDEHIVMTCPTMDNIYVVIPQIVLTMSKVPFDEFPESADHRYLLNESARYLMYLNTMMLILSCKNIVTSTINPHKKINAKRYKKNKPLIMPYNIFKVVRNGIKTKGGQMTDITKDLTHCPGHFKTYTEDAPLFGRHVGTWWWSPWIKDGYDDQYRERRVDVKP